MKSVASLNLENQRSVVSGAKIAKKIDERTKPRERACQTLEHFRVVNYH